MSVPQYRPSYLKGCNEWIRLSGEWEREDDVVGHCVNSVSLVPGLEHLPLLDNIIMKGEVNRIETYPITAFCFRTRPAAT